MHKPKMENIQILTADQVDHSKLDRFLSKVYRNIKSEFLREHGSWFHRGDENRLVALKGDEIVAYCATTPTRCVLKGKVCNAVWGIDMIVTPELRGKGLQTVMDNKLQELTDLKIAFPNELHAAIVQKHGWGVRDDLRYMLLPLRPTRLKHVLIARGIKGLFVKFVACLASPAAFFMRKRFTRYQPKTARRVDFPDPSALASLFFRYNYNEKLMTTYRDAEFFEWRYSQAPYSSELAYYLAGPMDAPSHALIARTMERNGIKMTRFLDIFGDFQDRDGVRDIIMLAIKDSAQEGSSQITVLDSIPDLVSVLKSLGFMFSMKVRFCWFSSSKTEMNAIRESDCYWTLGDSDNDAPE